MSDWDFLYEMNERGYSPEEIADAAGCGVAPWEWEYISNEWIDLSSQMNQASPFRVGRDFLLAFRNKHKFSKILLIAPPATSRTLAGTYKSGGNSERSTQRSNSDFAVMGHIRPVLTAQFPENLLR